jgi:ATP-dependent helicase/nuclease subunit B
LEILCTPNTNDVEEYVSRNYHGAKKILHIVPTMILYQRRANFYRKVLQKQNISMPIFHRLNDREINKILVNNKIHLFELNRLYERLIENNNALKVLTKREATIILERILKENPSTDNYVWKVVVSDIYELFQTISITDIKIEQLKSYSKNNSWLLLLEIYINYIEELKKNRLFDFGLALRSSILNHDFSNFDEIYIDGAFLPIEPGLHQIIEKLKEKTLNVKFFIPFDMKRPENPAFRVLKKTYVPYVPFKDWNTINYSEQSHNVVQKLARSIFTSETVTIDDPSLEIVEFETTEEEFSSIIARVSTLINKGIVKQNKIAIVTPKPMEMRPIVRELAELYNLNCEIPERPLINLPLGRLIYLLYQIYIDDRIDIFGASNHYIDSSMMSDLINLNIFNHYESVPLVFERLKAFFEDCTTFEQWYDQINYLKSARKKISEEYKYHPIFFVTNDELTQLYNFISYIEKISKGIFHENEFSFQDHLLYLLNTLNNERIFINIDIDTNDRLKNIVSSVNQDDNITIKVSEFGTKIQSIFKDENKEEDEYPKDQVKITVTGPNNVEYQEYDMIFLTRFSQNMYPDIISYKWPMTLELEHIILNSGTVLDNFVPKDLFLYYLDRSVYQMFTVLNSVSKKLTISYSKKDNGIEQSVSHYLHDIAKVFNIEENIDSDKKIEELLKDSHLLINPTSRPIRYPEYQNETNGDPIVKESLLTIEDIAVYEYCPRRFYYEKKYPEQRVYTEAFHLQNYASACLYEETVKLLAHKFPEVKRENKKVILLEIDKLIEIAKEILSDLFPFGNRYWEDIKLRTRFHLISLVNKILDSKEFNGAKISIEGQKVERKINGYNFLGERQLRVKYPNVTHYYSISNLKTLLSFSVNVKDKEESNQLRQIKNVYYEILRGFCYNNKETNHKLAVYANKITNQNFDKKSGGHCMYCSFKQVCMEKGI